MRKRRHIEKNKMENKNESTPHNRIVEYPPNNRKIIPDCSAGFNCVCAAARVCG